MTAQAALNAPRHRFLDWVAKKGEKGDNEIGHLSTGDAIIPVEKTRGNPKLQALLHQVYQEAGLNPHRFVVGAAGNKRNPRTGLREFEAGDPGGGDSGDSGDSGGNGGSTGSGPGGESPGAAGAAAAGGGAPSGAGGGDETGGGANAPGTGGNIGGAGPAASTGGGEETGGGANAPGTGGNIGNNPTGIGDPTSAAAQPSTQSFSGWLGSQLQGFLDNPVASAINLGVGMIPGIGPAVSLADAVSGHFGGPTVGSAVTGAGQAIGNAIGTGGPGTSTGSGGALGSGGGSADVPADQTAQNDEWLKRLNLA